jgi:hypothetical protein
MEIPKICLKTKKLKKEGKNFFVGNTTLCYGDKLCNFFRAHRYSSNNILWAEIECHLPLQIAQKVRPTTTTYLCVAILALSFSLNLEFANFSL